MSHLDYIDANRNRVERLWGRLKDRLKKWRAVATRGACPPAGKPDRGEKTATSFTGVLTLAAAIDWFRR